MLVKRRKAGAVATVRPEAHGGGCLGDHRCAGFEQRRVDDHVLRPDDADGMRQRGAAQLVLISAMLPPTRAMPSQIAAYSGRLHINRPTQSPTATPCARAQRE